LASPCDIHPLPLHDALPIFAVAAISTPSLTALAQNGPQVIDLSATIPSGLPDGFVEPAPARVRRASGWRSMIQLPGGYSRKLARDRKSTRLNSSHQIISYAV